MSYTADFGEDRPDQPSVQIATNRGWADAVRWAEALDADDYPCVRHLADHGWEDDLDGLLDQLRESLEKHPPSSDVDHVCEGLLDAISRHQSEGILVINGGVPTGPIAVASDPDTDGD